MKWQLSTIGQFYECGESTAIYFDPLSGNTHLISEFAAYLIRGLGDAQRSLDAEEIVALVAADFDPEYLPELSHTIPGILEELTDLDIIAST